MSLSHGCIYRYSYRSTPPTCATDPLRKRGDVLLNHHHHNLPKSDGVLLACIFISVQTRRKGEDGIAFEKKLDHHLFRTASPIIIMVIIIIIIMPSSICLSDC
jgi:hypothetical protein